jgi:hypothetical protein
MAELADAADSKSAGTWYLGGSIPPPGTSLCALLTLTHLRIRDLWLRVAYAPYYFRIQRVELAVFSTRVSLAVTGTTTAFGLFLQEVGREVGISRNGFSVISGPSTAGHLWECSWAHGLAASRGRIATLARRPNPEENGHAA